MAESASTTTPLRLIRLWACLGALLVGLVIYLSLAPLQFPPTGPPQSDKVMHFLAYGAMMFWFGQLVRKKFPSLLIGCGLALLGVALEYLQRETGYRTFDYLDMAANALGVAAGLLLSWTRMGGILSFFERLLSNLRILKSGKEEERDRDNL